MEFVLSDWLLILTLLETKHKDYVLPQLLSAAVNRQDYTRDYFQGIYFVQFLVI